MRANGSRSTRPVRRGKKAWHVLTLSSQLYPTKEGPRYLRGHGVTLALVTWTVLTFASMSWYLDRQNRQRQAGHENDAIAGLSDDEIDEMGDRSPRFMYLI